MASKTLLQVFSLIKSNFTVLLFLTCIVAQGYATYFRTNPCTRDRNSCTSVAEEKYYYDTRGEKYDGRVNIVCKNDRNQCQSLEDFKRYWGDDPQADASGYVPCKNDYNKCESEDQIRRYFGNNNGLQNSYNPWTFWLWY